MLSIVCWKWGHLFEAAYVNRLKAALGRCLSLPHQLFCVTDDPTGIDSDVQTVSLTQFTDTPRCRRRMPIFDKAFASQFGDRILAIDLDVVLVDDITPLVDRTEPLVCWKVQHAKVYSGSFLLMTPGVLQPLYDNFAADPVGFPKRVQAHGVPSDQAMLNFHLRGYRVPNWTERDGIVTYFGKGYERFEHLGVGPHRRQLPEGARIVVLGSADKRVLDEGQFEWARTHWGPPLRVGVAA